MELNVRNWPRGVWLRGGKWKCMCRKRRLGETTLQCVTCHVLRPGVLVGEWKDWDFWYCNCIVGEGARLLSYAILGSCQECKTNRPSLLSRPTPERDQPEEADEPSHIHLDYYEKKLENLKEGIKATSKLYVLVQTKIKELEEKVKEIDRFQINGDHRRNEMFIRLLALEKQLKRVGRWGEGKYSGWRCNCEGAEFSHNVHASHDERCDYCNTTRPPARETAEEPKEEHSKRVGEWCEACCNPDVLLWVCYCDPPHWGSECENKHWHYSTGVDQCVECHAVRPEMPTVADAEVTVPSPIGTWLGDGTEHVWWVCNCPNGHNVINRQVELCTACITHQPPYPAPDPPVGTWDPEHPGMWKCHCGNLSYAAGIKKCHNGCESVCPPAEIVEVYSSPVDVEYLQKYEGEDGTVVFVGCVVAPGAHKPEEESIENHKIVRWENYEDYREGWWCECEAERPHHDSVKGCAKCSVSRPPYPEEEK